MKISGGCAIMTEDSGMKKIIIAVMRKGEPMSDLINRQDAIDAAINAVDEWDGGSNLTREDMIADAINNTVPSAEPEWKKGKWIPDEIAAYDMPKGEPRGWVPWLCSECGWCVGKHQTAFCPSCGADMRGEEDEVD